MCTGEQRGIHQHDDRADAHAKAAVAEKRRKPLGPQEDQQQQRAVERVAVQVLEYQKCRFATVIDRHAAYCARGRLHRKRLVNAPR